MSILEIPFSAFSGFNDVIENKIKKIDKSPFYLFAHKQCCYKLITQAVVTRQRRGVRSLTS